VGRTARRVCPAARSRPGCVGRSRSRRPAKRICGVLVGGRLGPHFSSAGNATPWRFHAQLEALHAPNCEAEPPPAGFWPLRRVLRADDCRPGSRARPPQSRTAAWPWKTPAWRLGRVANHASKPITSTRQMHRRGRSPRGVTKWGPACRQQRPGGAFVRRAERFATRPCRHAAAGESPHVGECERGRTGGVPDRRRSAERARPAQPGRLRAAGQAPRAIHSRRRFTVLRNVLTRPGAAAFPQPPTAETCGRLWIPGRAADAPARGAGSRAIHPQEVNRFSAPQVVQK
jgi:hypothetical protein